VESPTPGGGGRTRGLPTVLERWLPQALLQGLPPAWDQTFAEGSDGFRPGRAAHQAIARAHADLAEGSRGVVEREREKCFDRVPQEPLMRLVTERGTARRVRPRRDWDLQAGARTGEGFEATTAGTPQGGPLFPLGAKRLLAGCDKALARRGHRFVRYAEERNIYVKSARAGSGIACGPGRPASSPDAGRSRCLRPNGRGTAPGAGRAWAAQARGAGPPDASGGTTP
jgi:RNA-directed DNA polymerase